MLSKRAGYDCRRLKEVFYDFGWSFFFGGGGHSLRYTSLIICFYFILFIYAYIWKYLPSVKSISFLI